MANPSVVNLIDGKPFEQAESLDIDAGKGRRALKNGSGSGTFGPMPDDHLSKRVDGLQTLVYGLLGLIAAAFIGIFGTIVAYSSATNGRVDKVSETVSTLNRQVGETSTKVDEANRRLEHIESKIDEISEKIDKR